MKAIGKGWLNALTKDQAINGKSTDAVMKKVVVMNGLA